MSTYTNLIIVDNASDKLDLVAPHYIATVKDYLVGNIPEVILLKKHLRVVNLCNDYGYLKSGYYCSLLAEARGHRCIPSTSSILHSKWRRFHKYSLPDLELVLNDSDIEHVSLLENNTAVFFFGRTDIEKLHKFGRKLFDVFRLPMMSVSFSIKNNIWKIKKIEPLRLSELNGHIALFSEALNQYTGDFWHKAVKDKDKYWMAILHNPNDEHSPSNKKALKKFQQIGKEKHFYVELITKANFDSLLEYDALFIRETTNVNHHTYRFAQKAEKEGIPCIDDTLSIQRCSNKIYMYEMLKKKKIRTPQTDIIIKQKNSISLPSSFTFPVVLKTPDGSFSTGVFKVNSENELQERAAEIFKNSELLLVQEFLPSDYDWRIVILGGKPLFACRYYMAKKHWQIYNHGSKKNKEGNAECVSLEMVSPKIMKAALMSALFIGNGLYGVDIKEVNDIPYVIEINDNPNIDAGVEDKLYGDKIYEAIFDHFENLINK